MKELQTETRKASAKDERMSGFDKGEGCALPRCFAPRAARDDLYIIRGHGLGRMSVIFPTARMHRACIRDSHVRMLRLARWRENLRCEIEVNRGC